MPPTAVYIVVAVAIVCLCWLVDDILHRLDVNATGKVIVITGCDHGVGLELCRLVAREPVVLVACCVDDAGAARLRGVLAGCRARLHVLIVDVTADGSVHAMARHVAEISGGEVHALVNHADVNGGALCEWTPLATYRYVCNVNYIGVVAVTQALLPLLRAGRGGGARVVVTSSTAGVDGLACQPLLSAYAASKHAVEAFCRCLRAELVLSGVQVVTVNSGVTRTDMVTGSGENLRSHWKAAAAGAPEDWPWTPPRAGAVIASAAMALRFASEPRTVALTVRDAIFAAWPRRRYWVGLDTWVLFRWWSTLAPDWLTDVALAAVIRWASFY